MPRVVLLLAAVAMVAWLWSAQTPPSLHLCPVHEPCPPAALVHEPPPAAVAESSMSALMKESGTDKLWRHAYDRYYDLHFKEFRHKQGLTLLEIGADTGQSMRVWAEYFSEAAAIHGVRYGLSADSRQIACEWDAAACQKITILVRSSASVQRLGEC